MSSRTHPKNPWICNPKASRLLIFFCRRRVPILSRLYQMFLGCEIGAVLPTSVFFPHPQGIIIRSTTVIGENVVIGHQVTLGGRDLTEGAPIIEEGVYLGAGAKVLGKVRIGRGATVGANAVVTKDVPPGRTVVGGNRLLPSPSPYALD